MKRLAFALIGTATAIQILAWVCVADGHAILTPANEVQDRIVFRGGVIRIGTSIYLHDIATHASSGIQDLTLENCNLVIWTDVVDESQEQIIQADAEEDETLSRLQVQAGISGGGRKATVYLYSGGRRVCANDPRFGTDIANLWVGLTYLTHTDEARSRLDVAGVAPQHAIELVTSQSPPERSPAFLLGASDERRTQPLIQATVVFTSLCLLTGDSTVTLHDSDTLADAH